MYDRRRQKRHRKEPACTTCVNWRPAVEWKHHRNFREWLALAAVLSASGRHPSELPRWATGVSTLRTNRGDVTRFRVLSTGNKRRTLGQNGIRWNVLWLIIMYFFARKTHRSRCDLVLVSDRLREATENGLEHGTGRDVTTTHVECSVWRSGGRGIFRDPE